MTELDLVCDYAQWPHISTSLFYVGSLLGNIIFGNIADRFRKLGVIKDMSFNCSVETSTRDVGMLEHVKASETSKTSEPGETEEPSVTRKPDKPSEPLWMALTTNR